MLFASDVVDGVLARHWRVATNFGYVLDGVADRSTHIALVLALATLNQLSPILSFLIIFRDVLLYAARALFARWWAANAGFRRHVRVAAVLFKLPIGGLVVLRLVDASPSPLIDPISSDQLRTYLWFGAWALTVWSYGLLFVQIRRYAIADDADRAARTGP